MTRHGVPWGRYPDPGEHLSASSTASIAATSDAHHEPVLTELASQGNDTHGAFTWSVLERPG